MSILILLFCHYNQSLEHVPYAPWSGPDYFWSVIMLNVWHVHVIYPYIFLLCVHAVILSVTAVVFINLVLFITIIRPHVCVMVYVNRCMSCVQVVWNVMVCWTSALECDWCLWSTFLFDQHWCVPDMLSVLHEYSASHHCPYLVQLSSMVVAVSLYDYSMYSQPPIFPWKTIVDPVEKYRMLIIFINVYWFSQNLWQQHPIGSVEQ